jgi:hypothetical protein
MLDEMLGHAAQEARRVVSTFERPEIERRLGRMAARRLVQALALAAVVAVFVGLGLIIAQTQPIGTVPSTQPGIEINTDPLVIQAPRAFPPDFEIPGSAIEVPLDPITEFLPSDDAYIQSFIPDPEEIVAVGQLDDGAHRVFLVRGTLHVDSTDAPFPSACIIDTSGRGGMVSCVGAEDGPAPGFGLGGGEADATGFGFSMVWGMVPESTSVVMVTTPRGTYWQVPRGNVAFLAIQVFFDDPIEWQFFDAKGVSLGTDSFSP